MIRRTKYGLALVSMMALGFSVAPAFSDPIVIDSFDLDQQVGAVPIPPVVEQAAEVGPHGTIIGGYRDTEVISNAVNLLASTANVSGGVLAFSNAVGTTGSVNLVWDGMDSDPLSTDITGLGGEDLTQNGPWTTLDRFIVEIVSADLAGLSLTFTVYDMGGGVGSLNHTFGSAVASFTDEFLFSDFSGSVDFSDVGAIELLVDGPPELDAQFDLIGVGHGPIVPAPMTAALLLPMLAGVVIFRRRV